MKTYQQVIALSMLIGAVFTAQGAPVASGFCAGNAADGTTNCTACYAYGLGGIGPRYLAANNCDQLQNIVVDALEYKDSMTAVSSVDAVSLCNSKTWINITGNANAALVTNVCSDTVTVTNTGTACAAAAIPNCAQKACYRNNADNATAQSCMRCSNNFSGDGAADGESGLFPTCVAQVVGNCSYSPALDKAKCALCNATNLAVQNDELACVANTHTGCRRLAAANAYCDRCLANYYFNGLNCVQGYDAAAVAPTPAASSYCMANVTGATTCSACYNYGYGSVTARELATGACTNVVTNTITGCKWYNPRITSTKAMTDCGQCHNLTWMNITQTGNVVACSNTPTDAAQCTGTGLANCAANACYNPTAGNDEMVCRMPASGQKQDGAVNAVGLGYKGACIAVTITGCDVGDPYNSLKCYSCTAGKVVSFGGLTCVTVVLANCRVLAEKNDYCFECMNGYYFNGVTCTIGDATAHQGTPAATSYCMGNNDDLTTCSSCYNWNEGTINARELATGACGTNVTNTVTDCHWYNPLITATKAITDCGQCNAKTWMNITDNAVAANIAIACSDTALTGHGTTCATAITDCTQSVCYKNQANAYFARCKICNTGKKGNGVVTANVGYPSCAAQTINDCSFAHPFDNTKCAVCAANFAVASTELTCTAYTADAGCRKLTAGGWCNECKNNYYFNLKVCTIGYQAATAATTTTSAKMITVSVLMAALLFFLN